MRLSDVAQGALGGYEVLDCARDAVRPHVPPLLVMALLMWASCAAAYTMGADMPTGALRGASLAALCAALACIACAAARRARPVFLASMALLLGVGLGCMGALKVEEAAAGVNGHAGTATFVLASDASRSDFGVAAWADAHLEGGGSVRVRAFFEADGTLLRGDVLQGRAAFRKPKDASLDYYHGQGSLTQAMVDDVQVAPPDGLEGVLVGARRAAVSAFADHGGDAAGILQALACGFRQTIDESGEYERYKTCGLAHLVAVSGAHLAIVVALLSGALERAGVPRLVRAACTAAFICAYLVFAGVPVSAVRSAFMVALSLAAGIVRRRQASLSALAACIIAFLASDPVCSVSVSLLLSAGSTLGIVMFCGLFASWADGAPKAVRRFVVEPLGLTCSANLATQPVSAALFSQLPLVAPVANIVATPLFALACTAALASAAASVLVPAAAPAVCAVARICALPLMFAVDAMARIPYASIAVSLPAAPMIALSAAAMAALWLAWPRIRIGKAAVAGCAACALVAVFALIVPKPAADEIVMLDVGQGDAFLVRSGTAAVLIDTGNDDAGLRRALGEAGVRRLDAVIVTHHDDDHCGSLASLSSYVQIDAAYTARDGLSCSCGHCAAMRRAAEDVADGGLAGLAPGDAMQVGRFRLEVVWPDAFADEGGNGDSLCLLAGLDCDGDGAADWRALFLGDAESEQSGRMLDLGRVGDVDVLKVGHHGSRASLTESVAARLAPEIALVSVGAGNRYGHPSDEALSCLDACGATVLRTDELGCVRLSFAREGIRIASDKVG